MSVVAAIIDSQHMKPEAHIYCPKCDSKYMELNLTRPVWHCTRCLIEFPKDRCKIRTKWIAR